MGNKSCVDMRNEWTFGGELFYMKEQTGEFAASFKVRGISQRNNSNASQICEMTCLAGDDVYKDFKKRRVKVYDNVVLSGHVETWQKVRESGKVVVKQMFIVDYLLDVCEK